MSGHDPPVRGVPPAPLFVPGQRFHVDIPHEERKDEDESSDHLGKKGVDLPLDGRTLQEVQHEAMQIKLGAEFTSFDEFNRCIDSWGVLNHRAVQRYKTSSNCVIRNCRFGKAPCTRVGKTSAPLDPRGTSQKCFDPSSSDSDGEDSDSCGSGSTGGKENNPAKVLSMDETSTRQSGYVNQPPLTYEQQEDLAFENGIREMTSRHRAQTAHPQLPGNRQPLGELSTNKPTGPVLPTPTSSKRAKSVVKHTSEWLPGRRSVLAGAEGEKAAKKKSLTGVCGQLSRFRPSTEYDPTNPGTGEACPFYVRAIRKKRSGVITITQCNVTHNCPQHGHKWRGPTTRAHWLAVTLAPRVIRTVKGPVRELTMGLQMHCQLPADVAR